MGHFSDGASQAQQEERRQAAVKAIISFMF
jgi:hypothetical protein